MENNPENKSSVDFFDFMDKYEHDNPVVIPEHVLESIKEQQEEYNDSKLSHERWDELNKKHQERMAGSDDDDLYYQLYYAKKYDPVLVHSLEARLHLCYCGSGKKYSACHGK